MHVNRVNISKRIFDIVGGLVNFLSMIDVGEISCTGCISNRTFKITCLNRVPVLMFFFPAVCTLIYTLN